MYLGIDLGTSGLKLLLLDAEQRIIATADAPLSAQQPQLGWSEQDPQAWWAGLELAVAALRHQAPAAWQAVRAIGLSGQMHGAVLLDARDQVLRPAILWNDGRAARECAELEQSVPDSRRISGNLAMPGFTAPKLCWLRKHEAALFARIRKVLLPKDWLRLQLCGEAVSEMSDASGTLWLDVGARRWSATMLAACGLDETQMPRLVEGSSLSGTLRAELARRWGLPPGVKLAGGAGDNAASAIGIGAVAPGQGFISLGTSGVAFLVSDGFRPAPAQAVHAFAHALPASWHQMAVMLSAASAFGWVSRLTGSADAASLAAQVAQLPIALRERAPLFLPYLSGERTPHNNAAASGVFIGLRHEHDAAALGYAVMEGVGFGLLDGMQAMGQAGPGEALALVGGGARSSAWGQLLAAQLGRPLYRPEHAPVAAALGAARLAWLADGGELAQVCPPSTGELLQPDASVQAMLQARHARYQALYPALRAHF
jgi:xylulokinase